ncbi:MAG: phosphoenolpyruvate carboxykinase [Bacilli bacterium]
MKESIIINYSNAILDFTKEYCTSSEMIVNSTSFKRIVLLHLNYLKRKNKVIYNKLTKLESNDVVLLEDILKLYKLLLVFNLEEIDKTNSELSKYCINFDVILEFVETLYNYWRSIERYAIIHNGNSNNGIQNQNFINAQNNFENIILETYRRICEKLNKKRNLVYRQLIAGVNAGIVVNNTSMNFFKKQYQFLNSVETVETIILHPPFISYPRKNKRDKPFVESNSNPLDNLKLDTSDFICFPAMVGKYVAMIYFNKQYMAQGVTLANMFELVDITKTDVDKPDIIYVFGVDDQEKKANFYHDKYNDIYIGYLSAHEDFDYFGYMKKMILTLHNIKGINCNGLPLHGAMANIIMEDETEKNIIIVGDSGAGKSETLEALRGLENNGIKDINVIFDDMGIVFEDEKAYGTEIGAFVRLDDLDSGYAFKEIDRSIFMNPNKTNSRIAIPISTYETISKGYSIDMILYANNYDESEHRLSFFSNINDAISVFKDGKRLAKGTTTEIGLVTSYFANPFGPYQRQKQTDVLIKKYFTSFFNKNIKIGEIRTRLGIKGNETSGPKNAANQLLIELAKKKI